MPAWGYLLLADDHVFSCQDWDALVDRLVWARGKAHSTAMALVEAATALALGAQS